MGNQCFSYHKWLKEDQWSYLKLMRQWTRLFLQLFSDKKIYLAIDDPIVLRHSKKAPQSKFHHQHGSKTNLSQFVRGQCWVALAAVVDKVGRHTAFPLLLRLTPETGNRSKLRTARCLVRDLRQQFKDRAVTILVDSWYMGASFIQPTQHYNMTVIGPIRIDTALYKHPRQKKGRGHPESMGQSIQNLKLNGCH